MSENRFGRYLTYAAGEILLVVVGILIALQINNWNEARKDSERAQAHLAQLQSDLAFNVEELEFMAEGHAELVGELAFAIGVLKREAIQPDEVERFKWAILRIRQYPPVALHTGGYDTMVASGDLSVIKDQALKSKIVTVHSAYTQATERVRKMGDSLSLESSFWDAARAVSHPSGRGLAFEVDFEMLRDSPKTLMILSNERRNHQIAGEELQIAADLTRELMTRIEEALSVSQ